MAIKDAFGELPKATAKNIMLRVLTKNAEPIANAARPLAPVDWGDLKRSIRVLAAKPAAMPARLRFSSDARRRQPGRRWPCGARGEPKREQCRRSGDRPGRHSQCIMQAFGTDHHPPQAFMRPAWDRHRDELLLSIGKAMWDEIEAAAARRARKRAKDARKKT